MLDVPKCKMTGQITGNTIYEQIYISYQQPDVQLEVNAIKIIFLLLLYYNPY